MASVVVGHGGPRRRPPRAAHAGDPHPRHGDRGGAGRGRARRAGQAGLRAEPDRGRRPPAPAQLPGVVGAGRARRRVRRRQRPGRPRPLGRRRARRRRPADLPPAEHRALDPARLDVADRPVRAAARPRQLPQQRRRRPAQHGAAMAQRLPRPPADHVLPRDHRRRGLRRGPRAARAARRVGAGRRPRRLAAGRGDRDDPPRAARLAHVDDVRLWRAVPPASRALAAPLGPRSRRHRAGHRRRDEVVRRELGRDRRRDLDGSAARRGTPKPGRRAPARAPAPSATSSSSAACRWPAPSPGCCATCCCPTTRSSRSRSRRSG